MSCSRLPRWTPCSRGWPRPLMRAARPVSSSRFSSARTVAVSCCFRPTWPSFSPDPLTLPRLHRESLHPHSWVRPFTKPKCLVFLSFTLLDRTEAWNTLPNLLSVLFLLAGLQRSQEKSSICPSLQDFSFTSWNPEQVRETLQPPNLMLNFIPVIFVRSCLKVLRLWGKKVCVIILLTQGHTPALEPVAFQYFSWYFLTSRQSYALNTH